VGVAKRDYWNAIATKTSYGCWLSMAEISLILQFYTLMDGLANVVHFIGNALHSHVPDKLVEFLQK